MYEKPHKAITLVELLVVLATTGTLLAIVLPAMLHARESARNVSCVNNLRQIGFALASHEATHRHYPTNGWGGAWVGEPERGSGIEQPGGWIYNTLPFLGFQTIHQMTLGTDGFDRLHRASELLATPAATFHCPSRRSTNLLPYVWDDPLFNSLRPKFAFRSCYVGNGGGGDSIVFTDPGPTDRISVDSFGWDRFRTNGIFYARSTTRLAEVQDGLSHTYLVGEKYVRSDRRRYHNDIGDDQSAYIGDSWDTRRMAVHPPRHDGGFEKISSFGSRHSATWNMLFADGSVSSLSFMIDLDVHRRHGNRQDGT